MWNDYVWELYINSSGGQIIRFFEDNLSFKNRMLKPEYPEKIKRLLNTYMISEKTKNDIFELLENLYHELTKAEEINNDDFTFRDAEISEVADSIFEDWCMYLADVNSTADIDYRRLFGDYSNNIEWWTTLLAISTPGYFFIPYYFTFTYNVLELIAEHFDINLPAIPKKSDYKGRMWHYYNICMTLYKYRIDKKLSYFELCAFLYDFAPKYIGGTDSYIVKDLPAPKSAYFIGGNGSGDDVIAADNPNTVCAWQCNPETRAGDLIVMYHRTPISAITSIWLAQSVGFNDPFFWYYRMTYIGKPIKVNPISLSFIKSDSVLSKMPIVSCNMQGVNGVELMPSEYNRIVDISNADIIRLENVMNMSDEEYPNEKAVEDKLIKPLLFKLGYKPEEYTRQMYIEIGNHNHALIPDFVIHPKKWVGHQTGYAVIEAKRSIKTKKELEDAKGQVRGYAKLLSAKYAGVISKEAIYIMSSKDDYTEEIFTEKWECLTNADTMHNLRKIIGK